MSTHEAPTEQSSFGLTRDGGRWAFTDAEGQRFFSLGLNHADETNLKYPSNIEIWRQRYGSRDAWLKNGVTKDLRQWGFNTIGWTQEFVYGEVHAFQFDVPFNAGHSAQWGRADFDVAEMPYCLVLRFAPIEAWNINPAFPDVFSSEWEQRCAYIARSICADHADSRNLIGYFFEDVPCWVAHPTGEYFPGVEKGDDAALRSVADRYYQSIHDAIRLYDSNHLILGDRHNGNVGIPEVILDAMSPYVDVLSVQYFPGTTAAGRRQMRADLAAWHEHCGKPVLIADIGNWCATRHSPHRVTELPDQRARAEDYVAMFEAVADEPWLIGWHWCSYHENSSRGFGLKDPEDEAYDDLVGPIRDINTLVLARFAASPDDQEGRQA